MRFEAIVTGDPASPAVLLKDEASDCQAEIYAFGGLLNAFFVKRGDRSVNVVDGFSSPADARANSTHGFKSAKLSPFVCRMHKGRYSFNGKDYTTDKFFLGDHAIHGLLFDRVFSVLLTESSDESATVTLHYSYRGEDPGFIFPYEMEIKWTLGRDRQLKATTVVTNRSSMPMPLADGWHPYFRLGGSVDDWTLRFDSSTQLEYDADLLPTGGFLQDERFRSGSLLEGMDLDNSFMLDRGGKTVCVLENDQLQLLIEPGEEYPILQVYIPPHRTSIAIENLSGAPDNFNNGIGLLVLQPGESRSFTTSYTVKFTDPPQQPH